MSPRITHSKVSGKPNPTDASKVGGEDWDADHVITGLDIGTDVQAHDATLDALAGLTTAANKLPYFTNMDVAAVTDLSAYGRQLAAATSASVARAALELTSPIGGMVNRIINPNGQFAQAGLASTANGNYTGFDQWLALTQSNPVTPSQLTNVVNGAPYMMRMTQANASAQRMGWLQWIESVNCIDLRGSSVQLSAWVRMSAATTLRYAIVEWTGTADSITKDVVNDWTNGTFTAGQFFKSTTTTIVATGSTALTANTLANVYLSGTVSGSMNNLAVFFWTDSAQAQNVTLDLARVQLEVGLFATVFAPRAYGDELRMCQRYFYNGAPPARGVTSSATKADRLVCFHPGGRMRTRPTITMTSGLYVFDGGAFPAATSIAADHGTADILEFDLTFPAASLTSGRPACVFQGLGGNLNVDARL